MSFPKIMITTITGKISRARYRSVFHTIPWTSSPASPRIRYSESFGSMTVFSDLPRLENVHIIPAAAV